MRYLLDTNAVSRLARRPGGAIARRIEQVGEDAIWTSIIVAAELRFGVAKLGSTRLAKRVEAMLKLIPVLSLEPPADELYGRIRAGLERQGQVIGNNDLLIAAHALSLGSTVVTENEREFRRVPDLSVVNWTEEVAGAAG